MKSSSQYSARINSDGQIVNALVIEGYAAANLDNSEPAYYGFVDADGNWYIQKSTTSGAVTTYTYAVGTSGYSTAWTNRAAQSYGSYDTKF